MSIVRALTLAVLVAMPVSDLSGAAQAQPVLTAITPVEPGQWQLRTAGAAPRAMCVVDPAALFQIHHPGSACSRLVIADGRTSATVHYSCPGAGWGRTTVQVSTARLVRISSQGIADNAPFADETEARRVGNCPTRSASR